MKINEQRDRTLRAWLAMNGLTMVKVAKKAGVSRPLVSNTIRGEENNRKVFAALLDLGCPEKTLDLTARAKGEVKAIREAA